ncbi:Ankyrin-2 ankyrin [Colletotrichum higginsianum IMI 349063]|uniref:Ankyrin-2 ankyrin n=1 Tax=Colletotrichum higginsianum (strain IMI 349063) TaxID=759273 RepID=A0A1B7YW68_COLHI|nr:Ankyrin-2 ankyrin [Colletotrichum higginsianum IMI 349063]OBR16291.1 Ankyrin-2 ankyrin [Colletotrichum higginsianum IMI 349063]
MFSHEEHFGSHGTRPPAFDQFVNGLHTPNDLKQALFELFAKRLCRLKMDSSEAKLIAGALSTLQRGMGFLVEESDKKIRDVIKEHADCANEVKSDSVVGLRAFANKYATELLRLVTGCGLSLCSNRASTSGPSVTRLIMALVLGCFLRQVLHKDAPYWLKDRNCYVDNWVRDVIVQYDNKQIGIPRLDLFWTRLSIGGILDLSFLTDVVGLDEADNHGHTALHLAILNDNLPMATNLLNLGADPSPKATRTGHTLFHYAAAFGEEEIYRELKEH